MIRFLVMDVDGTLTDGKIYMGEDGEIFKAFSVKDGYGVKVILPQNNIIPIIITARNSRILINRCEELGITEVHQGVQGKLGFLRGIISDHCMDGEQYSLKNVAYIGDDVIDLPCMERVKEAGGVVGCPADAAGEVVRIADYVSSKNGGDGAVRDFIEWLVKEETRQKQGSSKFNRGIAKEIR